MLRILIFLIIILCPFFARAATSYLEQLKSLSRETSLATSTTWLALLHYAPHYLGLQNKGEIDGGGFYLAKDGKTDPQAEIDSTLANFLRTAVSGDDHPQCRFVARYAWLNKELNLGHSKFTEQNCPR